MDELGLLQRRLERERLARKEAEALLEQKSREVYLANEQLMLLSNSLREQAEETQSILQSAAEGIITYNADGSIRTFNSAAISMFRRNHVSDVPASIHEIFFDSDQVSKALFPSEPGSIESIPLIALQKDGRRFPTEVAVSRIDRATGPIFTCVARDTSRRQVFEAKLAHAKKMESIGILASGIAHEINTPVQFVTDNLRFLESAVDDIRTVLKLCQDFSTPASPTETSVAPSSCEVELSALKQNLQGIDIPFLVDEAPLAIEQSLDGMRRIATIVRSLKDLFCPAVQTKVSADVEQILQRAVLITASQWSDCGTVQVKLDSQSRPLVCYPSLLCEALINLLANSLEALQSVGRTRESGRVLVTAKWHTEGMDIQVSDNGPGIAREIQEHIFDPFFTTKGIGEGTGQGLAFVYDAIVTKHGGSIQLHSELSQGATFTLRLPQTYVEPTQEGTYDRAASHCG